MGSNEKCHFGEMPSEGGGVLFPAVFFFSVGWNVDGMAGAVAAALPRPVCPQDRPSAPQPVPLVRSGPATRPRL